MRGKGRERKKRVRRESVSCLFKREGKGKGRENVFSFQIFCIGDIIFLTKLAHVFPSNSFPKISSFPFCYPNKRFSILSNLSPSFSSISLYKHSVKEQ